MKKKATTPTTHCAVPMLGFAMGCAYGKCDHFTFGEEEEEAGAGAGRGAGTGREGVHCYVATEFDRCGPVYPVRSFIATSDGPSGPMVSQLKAYGSIFLFFF